MYRNIALAIIGGGILISTSVYVVRNNHEHASEMKSIIAIQSAPPAVFAQYLENQQPILIDVRTAAEFNDAYLNGALNIDYYADDFITQLSQLDQTRPYAIYCRSGSRTSDVLRIMRELGFVYVYDLAGGILAWENVGYTTCNSFTC